LRRFNVKFVLPVLWMRVIAMLVASTAIGMAGTACKSKSKKKDNPPAQKPADPAPVVNPSASPSPVAAANQQNSGPKITGTAANNPGLQYKVNETVRMQLGVEGSNVPGSQYEFSLARMPVGARLNNRQGPNPELVWNAAANGTYDVQVIARNMTECQKVLGNAQSCTIPTSQFGRVSPDPRFDLVQAFQIRVGDGVGTPPNYGYGTGGGIGYGDIGYNGPSTGCVTKSRQPCACR
jgi:hypothetical protein